MRVMAVIALHLFGSACLSSPEEAAGKEDAGVDADAGGCDAVFADEFRRSVIGDDWQYYGADTSLVSRGVDGERLFLAAMGGPDPKDLEDYAFGLVHTVTTFAVAEHAIEVDLDAEPGDSGDVFFGWLDDNQYLGMQALSNGSMTVVSGVLGAAQTAYCSGCVDFDADALHWRVRPAAAGGITFEISTDRAAWTQLTTVEPDEVPFLTAAPTVWAECNQTYTAAVQVDSAAVSVCSP
jgi:hypothetical protein